MRRFEVREVFNPYLGRNKFQVTLSGYGLLPTEQFGAYDTLDEAKEFIKNHKAAKGVVYVEPII